MPTNDLERERLFAQLGLLTGDRPLTNFSKETLDDIARREAVRGSRKSSIGHGFVIDSQTGDVVRDPGYASYESSRDALEADQRRQLQADMLARLGYGADLRAKQPKYESTPTEGGIVPTQINPNAPGGAHAEPVIPVRQQVPAADRQKAAEADRLAQEARDLYGELEKVRGVIRSPKDIGTEALSKVPIVGRGAARVMQEKSYSPEQLSIKTRGARYEQNLSNLAAGLALTGYEIEQRDRWSPFATGISQDESKRRLENIERDFKTRRDTILRASDLQPSPPPRSNSGWSAEEIR